MIEDFMAELEQPIRAIKLLTIFMQEQVCDDCTFFINKDQRDKNENTLAINYAIELVNKDILKLKRKYYKKMYRERYGA